MSYKLKLYVRLFVFTMLLYLPSLAVPFPTLDLSALTNDSSLIIVGKIVSVRDAGSNVLSIQGQSIPAQRKIAELHADRVLKGQHSKSAISFEFVQTTIYVGFADIKAEQFGMFFLRPDSRNGLTVTNCYYPYVVAAKTAPETTGSDFERVIAEVASVLAMPQTTLDDKVKAIAVLKLIDTPSTSKSLRLAANSGNTSVKLSSVAALLWRNDISKLEVAEKILLQTPIGIDQHLIVNLANALKGVKDPKAITTLARLLKSRHVEARRSSAYAIRHTGVDAAIEPLTKALYDSDRDVRYQAVMGLAVITEQYSWGPALDRYDSDERHYLTYWRSWAAKR